jgi:hypothetical protein
MGFQGAANINFLTGVSVVRFEVAANVSFLAGASLVRCSACKATGLSFARLPRYFDWGPGTTGSRPAFNQSTTVDLPRQHFLFERVV